MKISSLLFCLLSLTAPLCAQDAAEAPKEFGFNFNYQYSDKTGVTSIEIGYQREFPGAKHVPFDSTIMVKRGLISQETLSFLNDKGEVLGTLSSKFDAQGQLQGQQISETKGKARDLNWFKTSPKSPQITLPTSVVQAAYVLKNGKLSERTLFIQTPTGKREIHTHYDELGRRDSDAGSSARGKMTVQYFYNEEGLSRFTTTGDKDKPDEITLSRAPNGSVSQMVTKEEGVLSGRMIPMIDGEGKSTGLRMEDFKGGLLSSVLIMNFKGQSATREEYDAGVLVSRKVLTVDDQAGQKLQRLEEFEAGHLQKRTEYDENGAVKTITTFNADGSVKTTQNFQNGVEVAPAK